MRKLRKSIQLILVFLKAPAFVLHLSYCILMIFLMLSVILVSILIILNSTVRKIRHEFVATTRVDFCT